MSLLDKLKQYFIRENTVIKYNEVQIYESFNATYDAISTVSRCIDLICDSFAAMEYKIYQDTGQFDVPSKHRQFEKLLENPSSELGAYEFRRQSCSDLIFSGNSFLYNLGTEFQILHEVEYSPQNNPYLGDRRLETERLIHTRLLHDYTSKFGKSYLTRIEKELDLIATMLNFQKNHFKNNGIPGIILKSENPLSFKQKTKIMEEFMNMYSIMRGHSGKPFIADNSLSVDTIQHSFKDLQFNEGIENISERICAGLGVPSVLIKSGNNANISPNYKLFVYTTVYPFALNFASQLTRHLHQFYSKTEKLKVKPSLDNLVFLQDDKVKRNNAIKTLVTSGIVTINEAREMLHIPKSDDENADTLLIPANITGNHFEASPGASNDEE